MFSRHAASQIDAAIEDVFTGQHHALNLFLITFVKQQDRMNIAIAGVKHVDDADVVLLFGLLDEFKDFGKSGSRHDAVLGTAAGRQSADGSKGLFTTFPEKRAFFLGTRPLDFAGTHLHAQVDDGGCFLFHHAIESVDFDEQNSAGIERKTELEGFFEGTDDPLIHHFECCRNNTGADDATDGLGRVADGVEDGQHGSAGCRVACDAHPDSRDDAEGAFTADKQTGQIGGIAAATRAPQLHQFTFRRDKLDTENMVDRDSVLQCVRPAGVCCDISADGAGALAAGIGGVVKSGACQGLCQPHVDAAGFHNRVSVAQIDLQNAIHFGQCDHHTAADRQAATSEAGSGTAGHERDAESLTFPDDAYDFFGNEWKHHHIGRAFFDDVAITFVDQ